MIAYFRQISLQTQGLIVALLTGLIIFIGEATITSFICKYFPALNINNLTSLPQLKLILYVALITSIPIAILVWFWMKLTTQQIAQSINSFQEQLQKISPENSQIAKIELNHPSELSDLAAQINQKMDEVSKSLDAAQRETQKAQKAADDEKEAKKALQEKLKQFQQKISDIAAKNEKKDKKANLRGTIREFLDHIHSQVGDSEPVQALSSSSEREIQDYKAELEYRNAWLKALLDDTDKEIQAAEQVLLSLQK